MKRKMWLAGPLAALLWATPAKADSGVIVRTTLGLQGLQSLCLLNGCTVVSAIDGTLNQVFLLTTPLNPQTLVNVLRALPGIINAEVDQVLNLVPIGALNQLPTPLPAGLLSGRTLAAYPPNSGTMVWDSYVNQRRMIGIHSRVDVRDDAFAGHPELTLGLRNLNDPRCRLIDVAVPHHCP